MWRARHGYWMPKLPPARHGFAGACVTDIGCGSDALWRHKFSMGLLDLTSALSGFYWSVRVVFGLEMRGLFGWASVSGEDCFVRRMERIWRLGAAGFGTPENEGPCRGLNVGCWGLSRRAGAWS